MGKASWLCDAMHSLCSAGFVTFRLIIRSMKHAKSHGWAPFLCFVGYELSKGSSYLRYKLRGIAAPKKSVSEGTLSAHEHSQEDA